MSEQSVDGTDRPNTEYQLPTSSNSRVPKTGYSRLKSSENKGISISWKPVTTAKKKRNSIEKSPVQNSEWLSHSARTANDVPISQRGDSGAIPQRMRGARLHQFRFQLSARVRRVRLRKLLLRRNPSLQQRFRVAVSQRYLHTETDHPGDSDS